MNEQALKEALNKRREDMSLTFKAIQKQTGLGYNTVRRSFNNPMNSNTDSLVKIARAMGCDLIFAIGSSIGDELEPDKPIEPLGDNNEKEVG